MKGSIVYKVHSQEWVLKYNSIVNHVKMNIEHTLNPEDITPEIKSKYKLKNGVPLGVEFEYAELEPGHPIDITIISVEGDFTWSDIFKRYHDTYRSHFQSFEQWLEVNYYVPRRRPTM